MVPERLKMSAGGERLEEVLGRGEKEEMPGFEEGAFEIDGGEKFVGGRKRLANQEFLDKYVPVNQISKHTMRELIGSVQVVPAGEFDCQEVVEGFEGVWDLGSVCFYFWFILVTYLRCDRFVFLINGKYFQKVSNFKNPLDMKMLHV